jgi:hypothetical protein
MSDLGPTERRLLTALRAADEPTDGDRARVRARVLAKIGVASGVVSIAAKSSAAPAAASWKVGAAIVAVIGTVGGAAWIASAQRGVPAALPQSAGPAAAKPTAAAPASEPAAPVSAVDRAEHAERAESAKPAAELHAEPRPAKAPTGGRQQPADLDSELALLEQAQQALKRGDPARALEQLEKHAAEHPTGVLAAERAAVHAVALCESGKLTEGQLEARRFLDRNPTSPLGARVRAACFADKK